MYPKWTSHLKTVEEKDKFKTHLFSAKPILERVRDLISQEVNQLAKSELSQENYSTANWSHLQAHKNGFRQAMNIVDTLLNLDQQKKD